MAPKKIKSVLKITVIVGDSPAKLGPALGQRGLKPMDFLRDFNARVGSTEKGTPIPVILYIYTDKTFSFELKSPPATFLIKKVLGLTLGSKKPGSEMAGVLTLEQVRAIAKEKEADLTADSEENRIKSIIGTARSMGVNVEGEE